MQQTTLFDSMPPLKLSIRSLTIPSFKNNKMLITKTPQGKPLDPPLLITNPKLQKVMARITESIVSQLRCAFRTEGGVTLTGCSLRSAIASSVPDDDCWTRIPQITIRAELVEPGQEGCDILLERLS